jgi:hypothetical protein
MAEMESKERSLLGICLNLIDGSQRTALDLCKLLQIYANCPQNYGSQQEKLEENQ